jgi:4-amino-4-deoxy-L-arabinose transferase-like glycosyltransferase
MALKPAIDTANSESAQRAARADRSRVRFFFWTIGPALGLLQALALRNSIDHDAVAYLDMAARFLHGAHGALLNAYWSPLYPFLLAHAIVFASPYWQATALHLVNFAVYLLVLLSFDFLLNQILPRASQSALPDASPERMLRAVAYALALWCCLILTSLGQSHPDLLVMAAVFFAAGITERLRPRGPTLAWCAALGVVLGLGYLAKAAMFPLALVFLLVAILAARRQISPRAAALLAFAVFTFALIAGAYCYMLSRAEQRFTVGDSAKIAYAMEVNGAGAPAHPRQKIFDRPAIDIYADHLVGTNPGWYDPAYWRAGIEPKFNLARQADVLHRSLDIYFFVFTQLGAVFGGFLALLFIGDSRAALRRVAGRWPLYIPALAALAMYSLVHVELRFLGGFVALLCLALFLGVRETSPESRPFAAAIVLGVVIILGTQIAWEAGHNLVALVQNAQSSDWLIAKELESRGIHSGDRVATVGELPSIYWARLAGVTLTGEISAEDAAAFWAATPDLRAQIAGALSRAGIAAIVAQRPPQSALSAGSAEGDHNGWSEAGTTNYFVLPVQAFIPTGNTIPGGNINRLDSTSPQKSP